MYIMITTYCNMTCEHCFNYTDHPENMSFRTFTKVLKRWGHILQKKYGRICLGGGEPTVHPQFWKFLFYAMTYGTPWLATNGKRTEDCLRLIGLAKTGKVGVCLSLDKWHEPIEKKVVNAFMEGLIPKKNGHGYMSVNYKNDKRTTMTVTDDILYKAGKSQHGRTRCHCKHMRIFPNGLIKGCACDDSPIIGSVNNGIKKQYSLLPIQTTCYKDWKIGKDGLYRIQKIKKNIKVVL